MASAVPTRIDRRSRRQFLARAAAAAALPLPAACAGGSASYEEALASLERPFDLTAGARQRLREIVRYATLAASSHNTQPWTFAVTGSGLTVTPDFARRTPVVDPDDHHLFVSLGCATENLVHAARASGLEPDVQVREGSIDVALADTAPARTPLFDAIPLRQCSRSTYDGQPISASDRRLLEAAAQGDGVHAMLLTDKPQIEAVLEYVTRGNVAQIDNAAFVSELERSIRFNEHDAIESGDGLFSRSTGNPAVPRWLGHLMFSALFSADSENDKCATQLRSSSGVAVFVSDTNDRRHWIEAGRCYERFALQATALGIRNAFLNQPVEVANLRAQFARWLDLGPRRPDLIVRFGRGPTMPRSLRRPIEQILV